MPRSTVVGNGNLLVTLDKKLLVRDIYFPYVGLEDHTAYSHYHKIGIFADDDIHWLHSEECKSEVGYIKDSLITHNKTTNEKIGISLTFNDFVYPSKNIFLRKIMVHNLRDSERHLKLYFNQDFNLYGAKLKDTSLFDPDTGAILHYRQKRYFLINGHSNFGGISAYSTGKSEYKHYEGTWRDAEDGKLENNPIDQGSVDSTIEFEMHIKPNDAETLYVWYAAGENYHEVKKLNDYVIKNTPERLLENAINYWRSWVGKSHILESTDVSDKVKELYTRSLLVIRTQIDNRGGILAANDSDIMKFNKDTYTYVWPRDGAYVAYAMENAGYGEITKRFYRFCAKTITDEGYLLHKYNPDGSWGSSWHPWIDNEGEKIFPIQEDETALVIRSIWHHYEKFKDIEFLQEIYNSFVLKAVKFLLRFIDKKTGLPKESYDLWEEKRGVFAYTVASVISGLQSTIYIAQTLGRHAKVQKYKKVKDRMKKAFISYLYDEDLGRFIKSVKLKDGEVTERDTTLDASLFGIHFLKILPPDDPKLVSTVKALHEKLWVKSIIGGMARYENDFYHRYYHEPKIPGNPWIITTMWYADWLIATAEDSSDLEEARKLIEWVGYIANRAGMLPEQLQPFTGEHLSVSPLTWSHAAFVETVYNYDRKWHEFNIPISMSKTEASSKGKS
jgi:oligosaccharide amylase